jgi:hypothetical protein
MYKKKALNPTRGNKAVFQLSLGLDTVTGFSQTSAMNAQKPQPIIILIRLGHCLEAVFLQFAGGVATADCINLSILKA